MAKELITMRQIRNKQIGTKAALLVHEANARVLRAQITENWPTASNDNVVATCGRMLTSQRESIKECQRALRSLKLQLKATNRHYDLRHK